ncbi:hypothetical protein PV08_03257 [Exophiala spinifera]|uniref:Citrate transporter-like domain-containing protein n=1 Tax=Exophiala spinifera TaxID=91928 RepID=A0A0D2BJ94_9EURO|nr:uncharacterized protein PV08_03257 [Exophiala spinifera]KIW18968.1 hypothetical protein PV08_03257 [Exophiala spinifera]
MAEGLDTGQIKDWRSIVTLIIFFLTNLTVLFPFRVSLFFPTRVWHGILHLLRTLRIVSPRRRHLEYGNINDSTGKVKPFMRFQFPMNYVTAPLLADLFLLAISAIGRQEVHDGTVGADNISPIDIMAFFLTLAYIAVSIDASGLIRWLALKALEKGGENGHALYFYLYAFFFCLGSFIGNDPIILSGTAFLAYMTRVSDNIHTARAWIHAQFTVANVVSAILVSSNPTNLVLAGAFDIKFIHYTANMIVPVTVTGIVLFPFLLYVVFSGKDDVEKRDFIPSSIKPKSLPDAIMKLKPGNPNITHVKGGGEEEKDKKANNEKGKMRMAEEIMNPYIDEKSAAFGAILMSVTLVTILVLNAVSQTTGTHPVYWVTVPAAFVMCCWDAFYGLSQLPKWRRDFEEYQEKRDRIEQAELQRLAEEQTPSSQIAESKAKHDHGGNGSRSSALSEEDELVGGTRHAAMIDKDRVSHVESPSSSPNLRSATFPIAMARVNGSLSRTTNEKIYDEHFAHGALSSPTTNGKPVMGTSSTANEKEERSSDDMSEEFTTRPISGPTTFESLFKQTLGWLQSKFPTVTVVAAHLPFALVPFALSMFVLVQGLVTRGWVPVFAYGWDHWVNKTGTVGAVGGMGFLSVVLCNFAGTNIGSAILLSRVVQAWQEIHRQNGIPISDRTFWATVYSMAIGVNYGAFSAVFSASLAGLLWRDILERKYIEVKRLEFAKVNLPIISVAMAIGCAILVAEVYIVRDDSPYDR